LIRISRIRVSGGFCAQQRHGITDRRNDFGNIFVRMLHADQDCRYRQRSRPLAGKDVSIEGDVSESFSALGNGIFQMDDGSDVCGFTARISELLAMAAR
jgi:hypothetical protein